MMPSQDKHYALIFDARGNGGGIISPTITGDHQNRVTDYTALVIQKLDSSKCHPLTKEAGRTVLIIKAVEDMSYQNVTGCLSQGGHPGSYNGQDAYNDMLVVDESFNNTQTVFPHSGSRGLCSKLDGNGLQRSSDSNNSGGG